MWLDKEAMPRLQAKHFKGAAALTPRCRWIQQTCGVSRLFRFWKRWRWQECGVQDPAPSCSCSFQTRFEVRDQLRFTHLGCEGVRAAVVAEWKEQQTVAWDACSQHVGGAETTAWKALLEMGKFDFQAGQDGEGVVSLESAVGGLLVSKQGGTRSRASR